MRKIRGMWTANRTERERAIKALMLKGYDNSEAIDILNKRLFEYNPLGFSLDAMIARTCPKA